MKILHIIDSCPGMYGAEVMLLNLMREQMMLGLHPVLLSVGALDEEDVKPIEIAAAKHGIPYERFRSQRGYSPAAALKLVHFASDLRADLIHCHGYKSDIYLGSIPRWIRKQPVISTVHGWTATERLSRIGLYQLLHQFMLHRMDVVVRVTPVSGSFWHSFPLRSLRTHVVENGIPPLDFESCRESIPAEVSEFCGSGFIIGAIGRLSKEKGFTYLIQAFELLTGNRDDWKLIIIGDGTERQFLEKRIADMGLSRNVLLPGYLENAAHYLSLFNVFALPSLTEGLPITILEAMQMAVPIVATRVGGVPNLLQDGRGLLVEPQDPRGLAETICKIRDNPSLASNMTKSAKGFALSKYSSKRMAEEYLSIYKKLVEPHRT